MKPSATIRIIMQQVCQPDAHSPPTMVCACRLFVEMHRLRIELGRKRLDLVGGDQGVAVFGNLADRKILKVELWHDHPAAGPGSLEPLAVPVNRTALTLQARAGSVFAILLRRFRDFRGERHV